MSPRRDHLSVTVEEQQENLEGLRRQFDRSSALDELTGRTVDLEDAESDSKPGWGGCHRNRTPTSGRIISNFLRPYHSSSAASRGVSSI